jgi:N-acetyl-1-D-myo-inositol-2-amino-2-deoxy-alpha-D-glucopyranoside deacetylase
MRSYRRDLGEPWDISKIYWGVMSASAFREGLRTLREAGDTTSFEGMDPDNLPPFAAEDEDIDAMIDGSEFVDRKLEAMKAHASQIAVDGPFFAFSDNIGNRVWGAEFYRLAKGTAAPPEGGGFEDDLFAGL